MAYHLTLQKRDRPAHDPPPRFQLLGLLERSDQRRTFGRVSSPVARDPRFNLNANRMFRQSSAVGGRGGGEAGEVVAAFQQ